jgi:UDP-2-acetamido-3-amino-2,3-dideoxy-glucuronate N-acetyltransferase
MVNLKNFYSHPTSDISSDAVIGEGTKIWHHGQIMPGVLIGANCTLGKGVYIDAGVSIGSDVKIQNGVSVYKGVTIEDKCFIGPNVTFTNDLSPRAFSEDFIITKTLICEGASIGANATIICGTKIGQYSMIGAGSVITKNVGEYELFYGSPGSLKGFVCICGKKISKKTEGICICEH